MAEYKLTPDHLASATNWRKQGFSAEQVAELCSADGWHPVETIKMLKKHFGVSIGEGKNLVDRLQGPDAARANDYLRWQLDLVSLFPPEATEEDAERMESSTGWNMKLWALVNAERFGDIRAALDRFDPNTMTFPEMSLDEAKDLAVSKITSWDIGMELMEEHTAEHDFGWTFACQTTTYRESGDMLDMAIGHGPLLIDKFTGAIWTTGSALSVAACVSNYQRTGDPTRS